MAEQVIICRCEEVTKQEIIDAARSGAQTIAGVKRKTRAGMGLCQGRTCRRLVARILAEITGQEMKEIQPANFRPPVRPVKMETLS